MAFARKLEEYEDDLIIITFKSDSLKLSVRVTKRKRFGREDWYSATISYPSTTMGPTDMREFALALLEAAFTAEELDRNYPARQES